MDFTTSQESLTLYKLIVLYMLDKVAFPLTQSQISEFVLDKGYTNYLTLQQVISELIETNLITAHTTLNRTQLTITKEGKDSLGYFEGRISDAIKSEILDYFKSKELNVLKLKKNELEKYAQQEQETKTLGAMDLFAGVNLGAPVQSTPAPKMSKSASDFANNILDIPDFLKK